MPNRDFMALCHKKYVYPVVIGQQLIPLLYDSRAKNLHIRGGGCSLFAICFSSQSGCALPPPPSRVESALAHIVENVRLANVGRSFINRARALRVQIILHLDCTGG